MIIGYFWSSREAIRLGTGCGLSRQGSKNEGQDTGWEVVEEKGSSIIIKTAALQMAVGQADHPRCRPCGSRAHKGPVSRLSLPVSAIKMHPIRGVLRVAHGSDAPPSPAFQVAADGVILAPLGTSTLG